jgi:serine/threonine-protein kinase SRPK3
MKSMVCNYSSVKREIKAYEALSKSAKISEAAGKKYVRQVLDHFELSLCDRNYHFLIHEPLGVSLQTFLDLYRGSLPIYFVRHVTYQVLHALEFIHGAKVIHAGSILPFPHSVP